MSAPVPLAHHSLEWKPLPANRTATRTGGSEAGAAAAAGVANTGSDSIHGRAIETPRPRRKVRRVVGFHMTKFPCLIQLAADYAGKSCTIFHNSAYFD